MPSADKPSALSGIRRLLSKKGKNRDPQPVLVREDDRDSQLSLPPPADELRAGDTEYPPSTGQATTVGPATPDNLHHQANVDQFSPSDIEIETPAVVLPAREPARRAC